MSSESLGMWTKNEPVQRSRLDATREPVWLSLFTHRTPIIVLKCTFWRGAWCFLSHGTLRRWILCVMSWNLWRRSWIPVNHEGFCSVIFNHTVRLAQTVSK